MTGGVFGGAGGGSCERGEAIWLGMAGPFALSGSSSLARLFACGQLLCSCPWVGKDTVGVREDTPPGCPYAAFAMVGRKGMSSSFSGES